MRWLRNWFDRAVKRAVEATVLRLYNRGDITVTIRHVTEAKPCAACAGSGKQKPISPFDLAVMANKVGGLEPVRRHQMLMQGICLGCGGKGS